MPVPSQWRRDRSSIWLQHTHGSALLAAVSNQTADAMRFLIQDAKTDGKWEPKHRCCDRGLGGAIGKPLGDLCPSEQGDTQK